MMHRKTDEWFLARHPLRLVGSPIDFKGRHNAGVWPGLAWCWKGGYFASWQVGT